MFSRWGVSFWQLRFVDIYVNFRGSNYDKRTTMDSVFENLYTHSHYNRAIQWLKYRPKANKCRQTSRVGSPPINRLIQKTDNRVKIVIEVNLIL